MGKEITAAYCAEIQRKAICECDINKMEQDALEQQLSEAKAEIERLNHAIAHYKNDQVIAKDTEERLRNIIKDKL